MNFPENLKPKIIFEDTHLVVISKPAGLLSQESIDSDPNLVDYMRDYFGRFFVGLVHRLDRNTTGLMVVAKRTKSARRLTEALQAGTLKRSYLAWLIGSLKTKATWTHSLQKDERQNRVRVVPLKNANAKRASLTVVPIRESKFKELTITLAEFHLETGRSHQIRVQATEEGFPLLGDIKYCHQVSDTSRSFGRPALHSSVLEFPHPMTSEILRFEEPLPADMLKLMS